MWLLETNTRDIILQAEKSGFNPTAEQREQFTAFGVGGPDDSGSRIMSVAGDTADISINGVLTNKPSILAMIFGGGNTTYSDIISAIAAAEQNDAISNIILSVDSPGGHIDGLFNAVGAIAAAKKPVKAVVANQAASAAFALVAQADEIAAVNDATRLGSVGVRVDMAIDDDEVTITSTEAPKKAPDVRTEEGRAVVREQLDALHGIFASAIAKGRGTTVEKVNSDYGRGSMLLAKEALERGMIDSISGQIPHVTDSGNDSGATASGEPIVAGATPPFKDYPIDDKAWDSGAAARRWRDHTGSTDKPSATYKSGFFWYDTEKPEEFGSYKLPFVDIVDGSPKAIRRGVFAANSAMGGARGGVQLPAADRPKVQAHIDRYRDKIAEQDKTNATNGKNQREVSMDIEQLKTQHPATFAAAVQLGVSQERDRVSAHLKMGEASGAMDTATKAIADGTEFSAASVQADYMAAGLKKSELSARIEEDPGAIETPAASDGPSAADVVADFVCEQLGYDEGGNA